MTPAIRLLDARNTDYRVYEYQHTSAQRDYGIDASEQLGVAPQRVFKTLVAELDDHELVVAIVPVSARLHLKSLAAAAGAKKAFMADKTRVEKSTGYVLGGVSPLGQRKPLRTFIDRSARGFDTLFVSGGRRGLELELTPAALIAAVDATVTHLVDRN